MKNAKLKILLQGLFIFLIGSVGYCEVHASETVRIEQQSGIVRGVVVDKNGEPAIGATVKVAGSSQGTVTDLDGKFSIDVPAGSTLLISYIGYKTQVVKAGRGPLKVQLVEDNKVLNEVVVVGFGTQKKSDLTGAVSVVSGKDLANVPVTNATQALQGMVPGLQITQGNGSLEDVPSINVRGTTTIGQGTNGSPLILIDGMEGDLNTINPQDISSISVLKDAAASSIYGSRAPFGVILITTKSGSKNGKVQINYNDSFRWGQPINMKHMMNSVDFASWMNDAFTNGGDGIYFSTERMKDISDYAHATSVNPGTRKTSDGRTLYGISSNNGSTWADGYANGIDDVDWYDVVYKNTTFSQSHNFSANGGSNQLNFYTSFNYP
jgi:TonB-linked SusC/RagA family outer membrane protein